MIKNKTYSTERLLLRPVTEKDAEFIYILLNTPKWLKFIGDRKISSVAEARTYIKTKMLPQLEKLGYGDFLVLRKKDVLPIGTCGLCNREGLAGVDIGFAFLPAYEKKGYAFEAATKICDLGFTEFGLHTISAITAKNNFSSQKLLEKLGLENKGTTVLPNENEELVLYQLERGVK